MENGKFVISLDFELLWGIRDKRTIEQYGENIKGVHKVVPRLLEAFAKYQVRATFSTVGFLFFDTKDQLVNHVPKHLPPYKDQNLSPYVGHFDQVKPLANDDPYHYAPDLIRLIQKYPEQEIGSHTFSHYYCLEEGQTLESFKSDIEMALKVAQMSNITMTSLVFPRNQINEEYLKICTELGITCYRGTEHSWLYAARNAEEESTFRRGLRLMDAYINISGHNCYTDDYIKSKFPVDIPSSRFLRPYSTTFSFLENLRLSRIKSGMTHAAKNKLTYHLWWHPHNFGVNQNENFRFLESILAHYEMLHKKYRFNSYTMSDLAQKLRNG